MKKTSNKMTVEEAMQAIRDLDEMKIGLAKIDMSDWEMKVVAFAAYYDMGCLAIRIARQLEKADGTPVAQD